MYRICSGCLFLLPGGEASIFLGALGLLIEVLIHSLNWAHQDEYSVVYDDF